MQALKDVEGSGLLTPEELLNLGFTAVGDAPVVSRRASFHAVGGILGKNVRIDDFAVITGSVHLGDEVHVGPHCFISGTGGCVKLGKGSGISSFSVIYTKSRDFAEPATSSAVHVGAVSLGERVMIGAHCTIMPGTVIGDNAQVGAHCLVSGDLPAGSRNVSRASSMIRLGTR